MDNFQDVLPIIIVVVIALAILLYVILLNKGINREVKDVEKNDLNERRQSIKVSRVAGFIPIKFRAFYEALKVAMPANYIILPNIAVELLFQRNNRKELKLEGQYVSFGIFTITFTPVLVIQLNDYSVAADTVFNIKDNIKDLIRNLGIPVMDYEIRDNYNIDDLRRAIAKVMNPLYSDK